MADKKTASRTRRDPGFRENAGWGIGSATRSEDVVRAPGSAPASNGEAARADLLAIKSHIHRKLLERLKEKAQKFEEEIVPIEVLRQHAVDVPPDLSSLET